MYTQAHTHIPFFCSPRNWDHIIHIVLKLAFFLRTVCLGFLAVLINLINESRLFGELELSDNTTPGCVTSHKSLCLLGLQFPPFVKRGQADHRGFREVMPTSRAPQPLARLVTIWDNLQGPALLDLDGSRHFQ